MVISEKVMAFRKVFIDVFNMVINGSLAGYLRDPERTECSTMWATPVESFGGVLKPIPNERFWSSFSTQITWPPDCSWAKVWTWALAS